MSVAGIYVFVHHRVGAGQAGRLQAAYEQAAERLLGTTGLLGTELLAPADDPSRRVLLMHWDGKESFRAWERAERSRGHPSAMRPYQDRDRPGGHYEIYLARRGTSVNGSHPRKDAGDSHDTK